jgi:hypothetical protein
MSAPDHANDRRSARRRAASGNIRFECRPGTLGLGPSILLRVRDLSQTGALLQLKAAVSVKDEVEFSCDGPGVRVAKLYAKVVWAQAQNDGSFLVGIHFQRPLSFQELQAVTRSS